MLLIKTNLYALLSLILKNIKTMIIQYKDQIQPNGLKIMKKNTINFIKARLKSLFIKTILN